jgi:translation initiation factor 5A
MSKPMDLGALKVGSYIIIDGEPCRIVSYDHSKPGKHGSAKARITAVGVFDSKPHPFVGPVSTKVEVPLIDKRNGQIISKQGDTLQIMDLESQRWGCLIANPIHSWVQCQRKSRYL